MSTSVACLTLGCFRASRSEPPSPPPDDEHVLGIGVAEQRHVNQTFVVYILVNFGCLDHIVEDQDPAQRLGIVDAKILVLGLFEKTIDLIWTDNRRPGSHSSVNQSSIYAIPPSPWTGSQNVVRIISDKGIGQNIEETRHFRLRRAVLARSRSAKGKSEQPSRRSLRRPKLKDVAHLLAKAGIVLGLTLTLLFLLMVLFLPLPETRVPQSTQVLDIKGRPVSSVFVEDRIVISGQEMPEYLGKPSSR
jgi:hypothetical protein